MRGTLDVDQLLRSGAFGVRPVRRFVGERDLHIAGARAVLLLVGAMLELSCGKQTVNPGATGCEPRCSGNDCSARLECITDDVCPAGARCEDSRCVVAPYESLNSTTLISGFQVREFQLEVISGSTGQRFTFSVPAESRFAVCGLFSCTPTFEAIPEGARGRRMLNPTRCLIRSRTFSLHDSDETRVRSFSFTVMDLVRASRGECSGHSSLNDFGAGDDVDYPVVTGLSVGCWAYDDAAVIGATRLVQIAPEDFPEFGEVPRPDCPGHDGSYCYRQPGSGACRSGRCEVGLTPTLDDGAEVGDASAHRPCDDAPEGRACETQTRRVGRCLNGGCVDTGEGELDRPLIVSSCTIGDSEWLNCFPTQLGSIGTCRTQLCRSRCISNEDCPAPDDAGLSPRCVRAKRNQRLGVCVVEPEGRDGP